MMSGVSLFHFCLENDILQNLHPSVFEVKRCSCAVHTQLHYHTPSCFKYVRRCRARMGRPLYARSTVARDGFVHLRRDHPYVAPYNRILLACLRCSIDLSFIGPAITPAHCCISRTTLGKMRLENLFTI